MIKNKTITGIILLAGNSTRYGKNINKNFEKINDKPVISYSIDVFDKNQNIDDIILVVRKEDIDTVKEIIAKEQITKPTKIVIGGSSRQESVYNSIKESASDIVVIHDGARPLIKDKFIRECMENMDNYKGVTVGVKSKDTIKITDDNQEVISTTKRSNTWLIQTPQCFDRKILLEIHNKYRDDNSATDDCMLLEKENYKVKIIEGDYSNIKITTSDDLDFIRCYLKK